MFENGVQWWGSQNGGEGGAQREFVGGIQLNACSEIINLIR